MSQHRYSPRSLILDLAIIILSVSFAIFLAKSNFLFAILSATEDIHILGSFIAGMFFTSVFTTAPAIVALGEISLVHSLFLTAFFGAIGSVIGDLVIFRFVRDRFSAHVAEILQHTTVRRRMRALMKKDFLRWFTFLIGGLILASPLPDELGISLLGFSKMDVSRFVLLSFVFNFLGIVAIGLVARSL